MTRQPGQIEVRFAQVADGPTVNSLFNRVFHEKRSLEEFDWKFRGSPWAGAVPPAVIGKLDGRLVSVFGLLPHRFWRGDQELTAVQVVDVCVDPDHRREGIHRATLEFFLRHGGEFAQFAFGFPGPTYAQIGMEKLAYRLLSVVRAYAWEPGCRDQSDHESVPADVTLDDAACLDHDWSRLLTACAGAAAFRRNVRWIISGGDIRAFPIEGTGFWWPDEARRWKLWSSCACLTADGRHGSRIFELLALFARKEYRNFCTRCIRQYGAEILAASHLLVQ